jgi:hypothetical protein
MKNGRPAILALFFIFFFTSFFFLYAQDGDGETRFIQRLTWTGDEYSRRYEVVIEREEGGSYREIRREFTADLFIDVPLLLGKYRSLVIPYNFLDMAGDASPWMYIEVLAALNPELDMLPGFVLSKTRSGTVLYEMAVSGKNLIRGAEIFLLGSGGERVVPVEIQNGGDGAHVRLFFAKDHLIAGDYELMVINPGGLRTSRTGIPFPPLEPIGKNKAASLADKADLFISAAWMPSFTIFDYKNNFFGRNMSLAGSSLRFGAVWAKSFLGFTPGLELAASYNFFNADPGGQAHLWGVGLNFLVLKRLPGGKAERVPMALTFRLGGGYSVFFQTNMGVSFMLFVMNNWYLETGLDYAHWFTNSYPYPSSFRPWIGVGFYK